MDVTGYDEWHKWECQYKSRKSCYFPYIPYSILLFTGKRIPNQTDSRRKGHKKSEFHNDKQRTELHNLRWHTWSHLQIHEIFNLGISSLEMRFVKVTDEDIGEVIASARWPLYDSYTEDQLDKRKQRTKQVLREQFMPILQTLFVSIEVSIWEHIHISCWRTWRPVRSIAAKWLHPCLNGGASIWHTMRLKSYLESGNDLVILYEHSGFYVVNEIEHGHKRQRKVK